MAPRAATLWWRIGVPPFLLAFVLLAFIPALQAGFVNWDDYPLLFNNTRYQELTLENLRWMFTTSYAGHFQPLTWLSYSLDYQIWMRSAFGFHLTNVLLHLGTTLVFYFVARRLIAIGTASEDRIFSRSSILSAAFAAVLFAVHPLRAESVAWVAERRDVLSGFFFLLAVAAYLAFATRGTVASPQSAPTGPWPRRLYYAAALMACALSLLAKATAMTLPVVLLVLDVYPLRRIGRRTPPGPPLVRGGAAVSPSERGGAAVSPTGKGGGGERVWAEKVPFLLLSLAAAGRALLAQERGGALTGVAEHGVLARLAQACYGLLFYLRKTIWPNNLGPLYEIPPPEVLLGPMFWSSAVFLALIVAVAVKTRRRWPALAASLAAYAIILSPVLGLAQSGPQLVADRYSYLSCMGFAVLGGLMLLHWSRRPTWTVLSRPTALMSLVVAIVCISLHHATFAQADIWRDELRLWRQGVKVSPDSAVAHVNLADALAERQEHNKAITLYERALELDPEDAVAHHHLADAYRTIGFNEVAISHYLKALRIDPARTRACYRLAELFSNSGRGDLAVIILRDGAQRRPDDVEIIDYLARLLASHPDDNVRNGPEALVWAERVVAVRGDNDVPSLMTLSVALAENLRFDHAIRTAERALDLATDADAEQQIHRINRRLAIFRQHKPFRMQEGD